MLGVIDSSFSFAIGKFGDRFTELKDRNERGFVLVFCSVTLLVMTSLGGFAVDVGNWYSKASKLQNAADAASLAGAPYLPGDVNGAIAAAKQSLEQNGFGHALVNDQAGDVHGGAGVKKDTPTVYISQDATYPSRLKVEVGQTVPNYFTSLLGYNQQTLIRAANASYRMAIPMGNPGTVLGAEPFGTVQNASLNVSGNSAYWLNIAGGASDKINGDKYTAMNCSASTVDGCSDNTTDDYKEGEKYQGGDTRAHQYLLHVPAGVSGPITLQVFDGAFVDTGSGCNVAQVNGNVNPNNGQKYGIDLTDPALAAQAPSSVPDLYASGPDSPYCTGDSASSLPNSHSLDKAPELTLEVFNVTGDVDGKLDTQVGDSKTYPSVTVKDSASLANQLATNKDGIKDSFRQWNTFVTIHPPSGKDGGKNVHGYDYIIRAETPKNSYGNNHFSLRAGLGDELNWNRTGNKGMSLSAKGHFAVFTNSKSRTSKFYFAKFTDSQAGRVIDVNLFDIGDGPAPISVKLIRPTNASGLTNNFGRCEQLGPYNYSILRENVGCRIVEAERTAVGSVPGYDGRNVTLHFTLPTDYRCTDDGGSGCWMALEFETSKPAQDTTTWEILDCGRPLRLIETGKPEALDNCPSPSGVKATPEEPTTTTTEAPTTTTQRQTTTTTKQTTTTRKPNTSTTQRPNTSTTQRQTTTTQRQTSTTQRQTTTTQRQTTTTRKPTTTTQRPTTTTTIYIGGT